MPPKSQKVKVGNTMIHVVYKYNHMLGTEWWEASALIGPATFRVRGSNPFDAIGRLVFAHQANFKATVVEQGFQVSV